MGGREPVVTIDGPAGAGKSTVARRLAERLGYRFIDTGATYRALAWSVAAADLPPLDNDELRRHLAGVDITLEDDRVLVDGRDVTEEIRTPAISRLTSRLTTLGVVREKLTPLQRRLAAAGGAILEGRDTGTVVCPEAAVKFYLDASLEARARRRQAELHGRGIVMPLEVVRKEIAARDDQDQTRALAPLRQPEGAIYLDTSHLTVDEVVEEMLKAVDRGRCCTRS